MSKPKTVYAVVDYGDPRDPVGASFKTQTWKPEKTLNLRHLRHPCDARKIGDALNKYIMRRGCTPDRVRVHASMMQHLMLTQFTDKPVLFGVRATR